MPLSSALCNSCSKFSSWCASASSSVSPWPNTRMSSAIIVIPVSPSSCSASFLWNISGAGDTPKGSRVHLKRPWGVLKVVRRLDSSSSLQCQNPFRRSHTEKTFAFASFGRTSSRVGSGYMLLFSARFNGLGSIHRRIFWLSFFFCYHHAGNPLCWCGHFFKNSNIFQTCELRGLGPAVHSHTWFVHPLNVRRTCFRCPAEFDVWGSSSVVIGAASWCSLFHKQFCRESCIVTQVLEVARSR